jgi:hypothetical protein
MSSPGGPGLDAIHGLTDARKDVDARDERGHDDEDRAGICAIS